MAVFREACKWLAIRSIRGLLDSPIFLQKHKNHNLALQPVIYQLGVSFWCNITSLFDRSPSK
jgi:hypothetical protein